MSCATATRVTRAVALKQIDRGLILCFVDVYIFFLPFV